MRPLGPPSTFSPREADTILHAKQGTGDEIRPAGGHVKEIFSHRSGYNGSGNLWYGTDLSRLEVLEAMRYEPQANPFRTTFVYNNNMYMAAGEVIPAIDEDIVAEMHTPPSLSLARYVGTYRHEAMGDFVVTQESGGLVLRHSRDHIGDLSHWHFDTFRIDWRYPTANDSFVTFELDAQARVEEADLQGYGELTRVRD